MSDILYLQVKAHAGKLRTDEGGQAVNTTGDLATLTANTGKDMYLAKAHANVALEAVSNHIGTGTIVLKINGTIEDIWNFALVVTAGESGTIMDDHEFTTGCKVTAGQTIKLECTVAGTNVLTEGQIECTEENTGESPFQATEFA